MTKPAGSLGMLENISEQLAGLAEVPAADPRAGPVAVFAGDHGVQAQGVTPWPQEVTAQMVANFLAGGAVVNAFAKAGRRRGLRGGRRRRRRLRPPPACCRARSARVPPT